MSQDTNNTAAFINAEQYSQFILTQLPETLLPDTFSRDVSDFGSGTTLNIKTVGTRTIQDVSENVPLTSSPIDSNTITMTIDEYTGDRWHVSDELREDGDQVDTLMQMSAMESTRAMAEDFESKYMVQAGITSQTLNNANNVNGFAHRFVGGGTANVIEVADFAFMNLVFNKAKVPQAGRIALVDASVGFTLDTLTNIVNVSNNPMFEGMVTEGFAQDHKFVKNIYGWDIWTTNLIATAATNESGLFERDGSTGPAATTVGYAANVFQSILDDNTRPIMKAWRRQPSTEAWRNPEERRDEAQVTARFGFGTQRKDTIGVILTNTAVS